MKEKWVITSHDAKFNENAIYYFRKSYNFNAPKQGVIKITAEARYKLRINGKVVSFGPYKGNDHEKYYDTVNISEWLFSGENEIAVEVLALSSANDFSKHRFLSSVYRNGNSALFLEGEIVDGTQKVEIYTDSSWLCAKETSIDFIVPDYAYYGGMCEKIDLDFGKNLEWKPSKEMIKKEKIIFYGETKLWNLADSDFPKQAYIKHRLSNKDSNGTYDFSKIVTGFVKIKAHGKGKIKLVYAESYVFVENGIEVKKKRSDTSGEIRGDYDLFYVDGSVERETFWFRTFRYINAEIDGDVCIDDIFVYETHYPLNVSDCYDFGCERDNTLWKISLNTLICCMHETYEDCPYYEQLQYAMDTYLQMLYTMQISDDITLAKRAVHDFAVSLASGGVCQSRFPSITPQYITGFSLYIVMMLDAIEMNRGEHEFVRKYLGTIDTVFCRFDEISREDGLIIKDNYWNFVDWADGWEDGHGVPVSTKGEALTVYSLMYAYSLERAARLNTVFNRVDTAVQYNKIARGIKETVKKKCFCRNTGLYADTDRLETFSQHAQVWAVLCGLEDIKTSKELMKKSFGLKTVGGFAYAYHVFRALEAAECYQLSELLMNKYYKLIDLDCTTIPEVFENPRSECHGWGAVVLYEFTAVILGVKSSDDAVLIKPYIENRDKAEGVVFTKHGKVYIKWTKKEAWFKITVHAQKNVKIKVVLPDNIVVFGIGECNGTCELKGE